MVGGLEHCAIFSPIYSWDDDPIWRAYFPKGLTPPTRWSRWTSMNFIQRRTSSYGQIIRSKFGSWIAAGCCYAVSDLSVPVWIISMWCILIPHSICHFHLLDILWICVVCFLNRNPVSSLSVWASALFCITYYNNSFIIFVQYRERCAELPLWACRAQDMKLKVVQRFISPFLVLA